MVGRFGTVEAAALEFCLDVNFNRRIPVPKNIRMRLSRNSGFFPATSSAVYDFAEMFSLMAKDFDITACRIRSVFGNYLQLEAKLINQLCAESQLLDLDVIYEPLGNSFGWINALAGK